MVRTALAVLAIAAALPAAAQDDISARLARDGLAPTEAHLAALTDPTPTDRFALGGVRFLLGIERALQTRYRYGLSGGLSDIPVLRLSIPENPEPEPLDPGAIEALFDGITADMGGALRALDPIGDGDAVALRIDTADLWFDINMNGSRDDGEGVLAVAAGQLNRGFRTTPDMIPPVVRFDTADAAWLAAYAHLLSGVGNTILAFDVTGAIDEIQTANRAMVDLSPPDLTTTGFFPQDQVASFVDLAQIVIKTLDSDPDPERTRAAHGHFLSVVAENRIFWTRVEAETDNDAEWIPNDRQTSALPLEFPEGTGTAWLAVLDDADRVLRGQLLVPHWRVGPGAGINIATLFQNPQRLGLFEMMQGEAFVPYFEKGDVIGSQNLRQFERLMGGDAGLFAVVLN